MDVRTTQIYDKGLLGLHILFVYSTELGSAQWKYKIGYKQLRNSIKHIVGLLVTWLVPYEGSEEHSVAPDHNSTCTLSDFLPIVVCVFSQS